MGIGTRRGFLGAIAAAWTAAAGGARLLGEPQGFGEGNVAPAAAPPPGDHHVDNGIYYFYGTGSNDGFSDHVTVTDPFEKHVWRTLDALKKDLEQHGCSMDSILQLQVFLCLPLADNVKMPAGTARFDAHKAQYDALNKIYHTYFSPGKSPSRACMALEWIPGDSLIEVVGCARVIGSSKNA